MATLTIFSNAATVADVLIRDAGICITLGGGSDTFIENDELFELQESQDLRTLLTDDAFGAGSSTLILNDGVVNIDQDDALNFLDTLILPESDEDFGVVKNNAEGEVDQPVTFDGTATITGIPDPTAPLDVVNKQYVDAATAGARTFKELVLVCEQLDSVNDAISQAGATWLLAAPVDGDTIVISDGATTETFTFQTTPLAAFDVQIGGDGDASTTNLATTINADSTLWSAVATTALTELNPVVTAIYRTNNSAQDSFDDRIFGVITTPTDAQYINFAGEPDYSSSISAQLPAADPAVKEFGFGRSSAALIPNETHACRDVDTLFTWDADSGTWQNTGANNPLLTDSRYVGKLLGFGISKKVPGKGIRYFSGPGDVATSSAGTIALRNGVITGASVSVNTADATNSYKVSIKINEVEVGTLALAATNTSTFSTALSIPFVAGDSISLSLERTAGSGASAFANASAVLELNEALGV